LGKVTIEKIIIMKNFYSKDIVTPEEFRQSFGDYTYGNPEISGRGFWNLRVGKFCSIAGGVKILLGGPHNYNRFSSYPFEAIKHEGVMTWPTSVANKDIISEKIGVTIGNDVWIGCRVTILAGVTIGDGAVIGAGAVVSKDIPAYAIAVGCPIKVIRYRFTPEQIEKLLKIKWWDFPIEKMSEVVKDLDCNINNFISKYEK